MKSVSRRWVLGILVGSVAGAGGASAALSFRDVEMLPSLGLRIPLPSRAQALPLPPVQTYDYTLKRGAETWKEQRFEPYALWYQSQHVGQWQDGDGNSVRLGAMTALLPEGFADKHVTREQFDQVAASAASRVEQADAATVHRWMLDFAGVRLQAPQTLAVNSSRLSALLRFPAEDPHVHAYAFRLDPRRAGATQASDVWLGLLVVTSGSNPTADRGVVERELIGGLGPTSRFAGTSNAPRVPTATATQVRPHPTREAAHRSVQSLADWWFLDSEDFVVLSNHRAAERFASDLLVDLQAARDLYARFVPAFAASAGDVSVVRIFATAQEYEAYVGVDHEWSGGIFDPSRRELVIRPPEARGRDAQYQRVLRVALHEAFHQYLFQATGGVPTSAWFNEGHATFFEVAEISDRRALVGENEPRMETLTRVLRSKEVDLRSLLTMDYATFYSGSDSEREARYSLAWGVVYFLQRGAPLERNQPHAAVLGRYLQSLARTSSASNATVAAFDGLAMDALERAFVEFWTTPRARNAARRAPLP